MKKNLGMIALILSLGCAACGSEDNNDPSDARPDTPVEDASPDTFGEDARADALSDEAADDGSDATADPQVVPTTSDEVFAYLQAGTYAALAAEPEVHASTGPHGQVRTFVNDTLRRSVDTMQDSHPVGSAAIKELYRGDALLGWAVSVKVADVAAGTQNWYWYEVFSTTTNDPVADSTSAPGCSGCHSGGTDFVLTPGPFVAP